MADLFKIFKADQKELDKLHLVNDVPHQHGFEELMIGVKGSLEHFIDFKLAEIHAPFASFITQGKMHKIKPAEYQQDHCELWVLCFKSEFIPQTAFQRYSNYHNFANVALPAGPRAERLIGLCELIAAEMEETAPDYSVIRHLLSAIFNMIEAERKKIIADASGFTETFNHKFKDFLALVEDNFYQAYDVGFYADKLFMTVRNLNHICQTILQKSVSQIIESRKLSEAMNLLINTDDPVAEIGFRLGYPEKAYFTSVFKRSTGRTPTQFKADMRALFA